MGREHSRFMVLNPRSTILVRAHATGRLGRLYRGGFPVIALIKSTGDNHFAHKSGNYHIHSAIKVASFYYQIHAAVNQLTESTKLRPLA
ncbi:hypothetical protein DPMN_167882 [Dreissena polymorpha]|uniref:Uncharacterized protein n=1 Tax=Dreissena polymorpha TaxID=45954 RepID=A0A9D4IVE8_DREPO|nr:hypothetical protein DPMN_167882 [Dreissena polymorpha]